MNKETNVGYNVEVKTTAKKRGPKSKRPLSWVLSNKAETNFSDNLIYCFVQLIDNDSMPRFFLVPSKEVARTVKNDHANWVNKPREKPVKGETTMRKFKIELSDPNGYENNWSLLEN